MQETSPTYSLLTVVWVLTDKNGTQRSVQSTNITLTLSTGFRSKVENSELHQNLIAAIVIFVITYLVATVTIIAIVVTICMWKVRKGWRKKVHDAMASKPRRKQSYYTRRMCVATSRTKVVSSMVIQGAITSSLRRTHSTIGFPATAEYYLREKHSSKFFRPNQAVSLPTLKCKSMPDLAQSQIDSLPIEEILLEPRRNLNTVHTRVKMLNSNPTKLQKNSARKHLNTVDNLRTSCKPKLNNCIVIEDKLNTERCGFVCRT